MAISGRESQGAPAWRSTPWSRPAAAGGVLVNEPMAAPPLLGPAVTTAGWRGVSVLRCPAVTTAGWRGVSVLRCPAVEGLNFLDVDNG